MRIDNKFNIGDTVYLVTDNDQSQRMVTMIKLTPGTIIYQVCKGTEASDHYEIELSDERNIILATS